MKKQTICLALSPCIIAGYLLANNMFSNKQQQIHEENINSITNYGQIMVENKIKLNANQIKVTESIQGISGISTYSIKNLKSTTDSPKSKGEESSKDKDEKKTSKEKQTKEKKKNKYSEEDLMLLAGIIQNEAGSDFISDEHQRAVASVVLNRVNNDKFPDTIENVITQRGQYAINYKEFYNPSKRAIKNAKYVLENGSTLPSNCVFQAEFKQGSGVYKIFETPISTTYICTIDD